MLAWLLLGGSPLDGRGGTCSTTRWTPSPTTTSKPRASINLGQAFRGGLAAGYPVYTPGASVLHGFDISTPCGSFSFGQGLVDNLAGMLDPSADHPAASRPRRRA